MYSGMDDDTYDAEEQKFFGMYLGTVVERDPALKRVRVRIDGIKEKSEWAYPIGGAAGGSKGVGMIGTPRESASVCVWFANGDPDRPYYQPAHWGENEIPEEVADRPDATIWTSEEYAILFDDTDGERKLVIKSRKTNQAIEFDTEQNALTIRGTTAISIEAIGVVSIDAAQILLNGRSVMPSGSPI